MKNSTFSLDGKIFYQAKDLDREQTKMLIEGFVKAFDPFQKPSVFQQAKIQPKGV